MIYFNYYHYHYYYNFTCIFKFISMNNNLNKSKIIKKEDYQTLKNIINELESNPDSTDFLFPVDYIAYGLHDYPKIINQPMDLGTVKVFFIFYYIINYYKLIKNIKLQLIIANKKEKLKQFKI